MSLHFDVIIVGAGHGGAQTAIALRSKGFTGTIAMIGRENVPPYERPPLSKDYLSQEKPFERLYLRPPSFWVEKDIALKLSVEVVCVNADRHELTCGDGQIYQYGKLIWAAGGDPRTLNCPGSTLKGIHTVRTKDDADNIMAALDDVNHVTVVGGGYIGLEAAAVLTKLGKSVTVLEALPRVLARVAGEELSAFFEKEHRDHGVDLRTDTKLEGLIGEGHVQAVILDNGDTIATDLVIVGIGIIPSVQPLIDAGATGDNGVFVDALCQTSLPDVFAIGDCAAHANDFVDGAVIRLESVQNANDQANVVAKLICGDPQPYAATPWFWSNQYDLKLQTVGLSTGYDDHVVRGDPVQRSFSVIYLNKGRVIALDCVNAVKDYAQGRKLVEARAIIAKEQLADTTVPLKEMIG